MKSFLLFFHFIATVMIWVEVETAMDFRGGQRILWAFAMLAWWLTLALTAGFLGAEIAV